MIQWTRNFTQSYNHMLKNISDLNATFKGSSLHPGVCTVSTMTICGVLNLYPLKLSTEWMRRIVEATDILERYGFTCTVNDSNQFLNCISINSGSASVKLFNNGKTQLTGAKALVHYLEIMDRVCSCLTEIHGTHHSLEESHIGIINVKCSINCHIPLQRFRDTMSTTHPTLVSSYDPDTRYPGVVCKHKEKKATLMVFKTGNIIICAKSPEDIEYMYTTGCTLLKSMDVEPLERENIHTSYKNNMDMFMIQHGYSSSILHLAHMDD